MQAQTLSDVAVMLRLAFRVLDIEINSQYDEQDLQKAGKQITNALLTSISVIVKETGLSVSETLGHDVEWFLARGQCGRRGKGARSECGGGVRHLGALLRQTEIAVCGLPDAKNVPSANQPQPPTHRR